ncbi:hypothetical protein [uncultured Selenomonas sp.]|uniref:hypothetical protein n=1 Tax=uncultured Selenomonas sp. TaxID=159275 RepID=UPI0025DFDE52|nr:hypothetical protein [uncultured Selenomonas sp.]
MGMLLLVLVLNLVISFFNARSVGRVWAESKAIGGWIRLVVWAGAIQSAIGFTYVYAFIVGYIAVSTGYLPAAMLGVLLNLMYVMIVVPLIGSAIIITIQSWITAARDRSLMNLGVAGWNTFATAYNTYNAVQSFGPALDSVQQGLGGVLGDGDSDDNAARVILLAAIVLLAGVLTTSVIIRRYEASLPVSEEVRNANRNLEYR